MAQVLQQMAPSMPLDHSRQDTNESQDTIGPTVRPSVSATNESVGFQFPASSAQMTTSVPTGEVLPGPSFNFAPTGAQAPATHHTRNHRSLALPSFSFNPSADLDRDAGSARSAPSESASPFSPPPHNSPSRGARHRRAQSEFAGNTTLNPAHVSPSTSTNSDALNTNRAVDQGSPTRPRHRHRRSGAMSSQDLSSIPQPLRHDNTDEAISPKSSSALTFALPPKPSSAFSSTRPSADLLRSAGATPSTSKSSSPVRVSFKEGHEVIPRRSLPNFDQQRSVAPRLIHSSDGRDGITQPDQHQLCDEPDTPNGWYLDTMHGGAGPLVIEDGQERLHGGSRASLGPGFTFRPGAYGSDGDADGDAEEVFGEPGFATITDNFDVNVVSSASIPNTIVTSPAPWASRTYQTESDSTESVLDLDSALDTSSGSSDVLSSQELRSLRGKSFSAARRSMHSSGLSLAGLPLLHRRTESAPNLPSVDRPSFPRLNSASASDKGFEMDNVFEEDEEDEDEAAAFVTPQTFPSTPLTADPPRTPLADIEERLSSDALSDVALSSQDTARSIPIVDASEHMYDGSKAYDEGEHRPTIRDSTSTITPELMVQASRINRPVVNGAAEHSGTPPATPGASCLSHPASSHDGTFGDNASQQLSDAASFAEMHQLGLPRALPDERRLSSDAASSLISSHSTMASAANRHGSAMPSPLTAESSTIGGPPSSSGSAHARWRKRSSLVSLSRLMSANGSARSHLSEEIRCQTSDGLSTASETPREGSGKRRTFSRLLHLFRHNKEDRQDSIG